MIRRLVLMIALLLPQTALAQAIRVQSGEHPGFTRLVLTIGQDRAWEIAEIEAETWQLVLDPAPDGFNLNQAFDLIPRTRLAELVEADGLRLDLACNCDVSSFRHDGIYLVIDIADPDPDAPVATAVATPDASIRDEERAAAAAALPDLARLLTDGSTPTPPAQATATPPQQVPDLRLDPSAAAETSPPPANPNLEDAANLMAEQLARAAAAGLLDVELGQPFDAADPIAAEQPEEEIATPAPVSPEEIAADTLPIHTENALDIALDLQRLTITDHTPGACQNVPFDARSWTEADSFFGGLGPLRLELYDERDVLVPDAALALAQHYLFFGFGAEAQYWIDRVDGAPEDLGHVAALLDGARTAPFPMVETPSDCSDGELLWRYLGGAVSVTLGNDDIDAIQRAFQALPAGLRDHMGPRLARQMHSDGLVGSARNIRDAVARGGRIDPAQLRVLDIDLGLVPDRAHDETRQVLAEALRDDGGDPVALMAAALAFDREQGQLPTPDRLTAADALLREYVGTPATEALWQEVLIGRAALGEIDTAINMLAEPGHSSAAWDMAMTNLVAERAAVNDIAALLILAHRFGRNWRPEGSVAGRAQVQAISALREAGYFAAAEILRDVRRPLILPARPEAEATPDLAAEAWDNRDWAALADEDAGVHADIANRLVRLEDAAEPPGTLDDLSADIADSRDLRAAIATLLSEPSLP